MDKENIITKLINRIDISEEEAFIKEYFIEKNEFEEIDFPLFFHLLAFSHIKEIAASSIVNLVSIEHLIDINSTIVFDFFENLFCIHQNDNIINVFHEYISSIEDIEPYILSIKSIIGLITYEDEDFIVKMIEFFISKLESEKRLYCENLLNIVICLVRKIHVNEIDLIPIFLFIISNKYINAVSFRQLLFQKFDNFTNDTKELACEFINTEIKELNGIKEYKDLIENLNDSWISQYRVFIEMFVTIFSIDNDESKKELLYIALALLKKLNILDKLWIEKIDMIIGFFDENYVPLCVFEDFMGLIMNLPDDVRNLYKINEKLIQRANTYGNLNENIIDFFIE